MEGFMVLCFVILTIGFILLVGSFVFLCIGKVTNNSSNSNKIEFQGPGGLKFSTNLPLVFTLFLGALLITYPLYEFRQYRRDQATASPGNTNLKFIPVTCKVDYQGSKNLTVYASIASDKIVNGEGTLMIPVIKNATYTAIGFMGDSGEPFARRIFSLKGDEDKYDLEITPPAAPPVAIANNLTPNAPVRTDEERAKSYRSPQAPGSGDGTQ